MIIPNERISPADEERPVTDEYIRALNLNRRIIVSAQLAQQNLYEMCAGFKEMRDSKLYKELGYTDFGEYCEQETGIKRRQVYNYITIIEKLPKDFVQSIAQIGMTKALLLTTLDDEKRAQITAETDLESATVKQLEQQVKQLRAEKDKAVADKSAAEADSALKSDEIAALERTKQTLDARITELGRRIKDLENRPVETAVQVVEKIPDKYVDISAYERLVEQHNAEREQMETEYLALKRQLGDVEKQLEEERSKPAQAVAQQDENEVFKAYFKAAYDGLNRLVEYVREHRTDDRYDRTIKLIDTVKASL